MSQEHVKAFYKRLGQDEVFKAQIEGAESPQECSQIIREAGYDFTQEEFEVFTAQLLDSSDAKNNFEELSEKALEAVFGGRPTYQCYGVIE
ncbi:conserved hypothetical protein [Hyella patelloides LEGE 07179]|uniref:Nif11 domain-containing protein n=1 Tax=Hyella patelloides LEGE 07179 TaxID=945734 RepID=A0A563W4E5_9CYAN|nr:Nif11-like leader peptide family natural product precursor [Hyella patelloides]VEP18561.1 conserved hypothetical protein [Hyella patelloides LEGE 07179]